MRFDTTITLGQVAQTLLVLGGILGFAFKLVRALDAVTLKLGFLTEVVESLKNKVETVTDKMNDVETRVTVLEEYKPHVDKRRSTSSGPHAA